MTEGKTVVGVAGDAVFATVRGGTKPTVYIPLAQSAGIGMPGRTGVNISIRAAAGPPAALARSVSAALTTVDPDLAFSFTDRCRSLSTRRYRRSASWPGWPVSLAGWRCS